MAVAPSPVVSHHLDHPELLLLDNAVARLAEQYISSRNLSALQREALADYRSDLDALIAELTGPARDYAEQVLALATTVLDASDDAPAHGAGSSRGAHRAA